MPTKSSFIFNRNQKAVYDGTDPIVHPEYLIPTDERDLLTEPKADWDIKYPLGNKFEGNTRNHIEVEQMDASRKIYEPLVNGYVSSYVKNNPKIPVGDKITMYIHIDSKVRTKTVKPTSTPVFIKKNTNVSLHIELFYKDSDVAGGHAKPHKEDVCQQYIFIIEIDKDGNKILPVSVADYWFAGDSSDYHINLAFDIKDGGKEIYILPRWSNAEGDGAFGVQAIATIPR